MIWSNENKQTLFLNAQRNVNNLKEIAGKPGTKPSLMHYIRFHLTGGLERIRTL